MTHTPTVSFLIIGVQKGGTTALYDYLGDYRDVALSYEKELHFFDDEAQNWTQPDYDAYHARFDDPVGYPCGEATPIYSYWPGAMERIAAYNPAMKLILVSRAWSHWRMEYARGVEREPFAWCIRQGRQRLFNTEPWGFHRESSYVERGFYGEQAERILALFPQKQLLALTSETLQSDPAFTLASVRAFLDLPSAPAPLPRQVHVGRQMDYPSPLTAEDVAHLRAVYADDNERLAALVGIRFGQAIFPS